MDWAPTHPQRAYRPDKISVEEFKSVLEASLSNYYDSGQVPQHYSQALVLTFCWDIEHSRHERVGNWANRLGDTFQDLYGYDVLHTSIPAFGENPHGIMSDVIRDTLYGGYGQPRLGKETLVIIYYVGHGSYTREPSDQSTLHLSPTWPPSPFDRPPGRIQDYYDGKIPRPDVNFTTIRRDLIDSAEPDVLMLIDCCYAGAGILGSGKEIIAASTWDNVARNGPRSFSANLIQQLQHAASTKQILTAPQLYARLATRAFTFDADGHTELASNPIHVQHYDHPRVPIYLGPIFKRLPVTNWWAARSGPTISQPAVVVLSVHLRDTENTTLSDLSAWLTQSRPDSVDRVTVQHAYHSSSMVVLFKVTFDVWSMLRGYPAIHFVAIEINDPTAGPISAAMAPLAPQRQPLSPIQDSRHRVTDEDLDALL